MRIRFLNLKDKHHFITSFKHVNPRDVIMRDIVTMDNDFECILSVRNDDFTYINMPYEYRDVEYKIIDRNDIGVWNKNERRKRDII